MFCAEALHLSFDIYLIKSLVFFFIRSWILRARCVIEVLRIIDEDLHCLEEWNKSGSISISMITCAYSRHERTSFDLVFVLLVNVGSLCDRT